MLFAVSRGGALLIMPRSLLGCQIKAEIKGFLLKYLLFLYQQWSIQNIDKGQRIFFCKIHHFQEIAEINFFQIFPQAFFNILKEPLVVQKQTIPQQKALYLSFNNPDSGRGIIRRAPHLLAVKSIGVRGVKKVLLWEVIVTPS